MKMKEKKKLSLQTAAVLTVTVKCPVLPVHFT